jgi:hypothetical protein
MLAACWPMWIPLQIAGWPILIVNAWSMLANVVWLANSILANSWRLPLTANWPIMLKCWEHAGQSGVTNSMLANVGPTAHSMLASVGPTAHSILANPSGNAGSMLANPPGNAWSILANMQLASQTTLASMLHAFPNLLQAHKPRDWPPCCLPPTQIGQPAPSRHQTEVLANML